MPLASLLKSLFLQQINECFPAIVSRCCLGRAGRVVDIWLVVLGGGLLQMKTVAGPLGGLATVLSLWGWE